MGSRDVDNFKEVGYKLKVVTCSMEKLIILDHLIQSICEHCEM